MSSFMLHSENLSGGSERITKCDLHNWTQAANILNKRSWTADEGWSYSLVCVWHQLLT